MKPIHGFWIFLAALVTGPLVIFVLTPILRYGAFSLTLLLQAVLAAAAFAMVFSEDDWGSRFLLILGSLMIGLFPLVTLLSWIGLSPIFFPVLYPLYSDLGTIRLIFVAGATLALGFWATNRPLSRISILLIVAAVLAFHWGGLTFIRITPPSPIALLATGVGIGCVAILIDAWLSREWRSTA